MPSWSDDRSTRTLRPSRPPVVTVVAPEVHDRCVGEQAEAIDPSVVAAKWDEIAAIVRKMMERVGDPNDFQVSLGSSLSGDDKASSPYQVSHAVRMCLAAGVDHLDAVRALLLELGKLHNAAPFSLVRGALENLSAAFWILHPTLRDARIERALRWHAKNFKDSHKALEPIGKSTEARREARLAKLDKIAVPRGISTKTVRGAYFSSDVVAYVEEHSTRSDPLLSWNFCSGYAHGRPWAYLGYSEQEHFETTAPDVLNVQLTTDPGRLLYPTLEAVHLLTDVVELLQQRSQRR
jgi:hypothetical protein